MAVLIMTLAIFLIVMLIMAVGVLFKRPCLRGSCGGPEVMGPDGEPVTCATCPNKDKKRREAASSPLPVLDS